MPIAFVYCLLPFAYCLLLCLFIALVSLEAPRSGKELAAEEAALASALWKKQSKQWDGCKIGMELLNDLTMQEFDEFMCIYADEPEKHELCRVFGIMVHAITIGDKDGCDARPLGMSRVDYWYKSLTDDSEDDSEDEGHEDGGDSECQDEPDAPVTISQSPAHEGEGWSIRLLPLAPPIAYCLLSIVFCLLHAPWYRTMGMKKESTPSVRMSRMHW